MVFSYDGFLLTVIQSQIVRMNKQQMLKKGGMMRRKHYLCHEKNIKEGQ